MEVKVAAGNKCFLVENDSKANYFFSGNPSYIEVGWENSNSVVVEISQEQF